MWSEHWTVPPGHTTDGRDTGPGAAASLDYGLSQRALIAVSARRNDVVEPDLITRRLVTFAPSGLQALDTATVRAVVRQAVRDIRTAPPLPADPPADPAVAALRRVVDDLVASTTSSGEPARLPCCPSSP